MLTRSAAGPAATATAAKAALTRIRIFPVKSLDAVETERARVLASGALEHDRSWALFDHAGDYINGKRHAAVHSLRSRMDLSARKLTLRDSRTPGLTEATFHIDRQRDALEQWLQRYFGFQVSLQDDLNRGFPDDTDSPGPTVISVATLAEIGRWFGLSIEDVRSRFRANLEIDGVPPFWEDRLFGPASTTVRFRIGDVIFDGINPCQRCVVPPRDAETGVSDDTFVRRFTELRERTLPAWSTRERFNHFYRVAINTRLNNVARGDVVQVGDEVEILDPPAHTMAAALRTPPQDYWTGELVVAAVRAETPSVKTFRLKNPNGDSLPFSFLAGQFVTVAVSSGAEILQRCYTIASSPARSDYCELTVKRDGQVSALLHDTYIAGSRLQVSGPMGRFTFDGNDTHAIVMIAGGVGLTPLMSKLRFLSDTQWPGTIDLIYSAKSGCEFIFQKELRDIERAMENVRVHVTVTGEDPAWTGARGRITAAGIAALVPNIAERPVHLCGPMEMAAATQKMLHELGVAESRIEIEAFGGPRSPAGQGGEQEVRFARSGRSAIVAGGQSLLDAALAAGVPLDHGCRAGVCGRCRTRVIEGEVAVTCDFVLTPEQKSQRIVLACQAHPMGPVSLDC